MRKHKLLFSEKLTPEEENKQLAKMVQEVCDKCDLLEKFNVPTFLTWLKYNGWYNTVDGKWTHSPRIFKTNQELYELFINDKFFK